MPAEDDLACIAVGLELYGDLIGGNTTGSAMRVRSGMAPVAIGPFRAPEAPMPDGVCLACEMGANYRGGTLF